MRPTEAINYWSTIRQLTEDVQKIAVWMPVTVEAMVDMGMWDSLSPEQQAAYLAKEARHEAWRRSWRGRWYRFTRAFDRIAHKLARWPQPEYDEPEYD